MMPMVGRDPPTRSPTTPTSIHSKGEPHGLCGIPPTVTLAHQETPLAVEDDTAADHYVSEPDMRAADTGPSCVR